MTCFTTIGAAAVISLAAATGAMAQSATTLGYGASVDSASNVRAGSSSAQSIKSDGEVMPVELRRDLDVGIGGDFENRSLDSNARQSWTGNNNDG
ncbi:hypothetical protein [Chenggangzhangella methanolivorans]|uniref:Uncharacterized protein n=1 Tax=Chenggangzhangella methanolivorans TaxID=1437009 RepID=A0A9E6RDC9_9HYPH|nr:hypothetical protein [Chenggangzhangella methanolivorans]QZO01785.1 hypothetical protein K6K41_10715 [Chenggangzhangella methanolivorans]